MMSPGSGINDLFTGAVSGVVSAEAFSKPVSDEGTLSARGTFTAGRLIASAMRGQVRSYAHTLGLTLKLEEDKSFLETMFLWEVTGPSMKVRAFAECLLGLIHANE
jgi:hypothetical protein